MPDINYVGNDLYGPWADSNINCTQTQTRHDYGKYIINEWNLNGFHSVSKPYNKVFKQTVVGNVYSDFWILPETHCQENDLIEIDNLKIYQNK